MLLQSLARDFTDVIYTTNTTVCFKHVCFRTAYLFVRHLMDLFENRNSIYLKAPMWRGEAFVKGDLISRTHQLCSDRQTLLITTQWKTQNSYRNYRDLNSEWFVEAKLIVSQNGGVVCEFRHQELPTAIVLVDSIIFDKYKNQAGLELKSSIQG